MVVRFVDENPLPPLGHIAETHIRQKLTPQSQAIYDQMDKGGKALVFQLVHQDNEENLAVKKAQKQITEQQLKTYLMDENTSEFFPLDRTKTDK